MRVRWLVASFAAAMTPAAARAATFVDYSNYCATASAFTACASVQVFTHAVAGGTTLEIRMRNLEGTHPLATAGTPLTGLMTFGSQKKVGSGYQSIMPFAGGMTYGTIGSVFGLADLLDDGWDIPAGCSPAGSSNCWPDRFEMWPAVYGCTIDPAVGDISSPDYVAPGLGVGGGFQTCPKAGSTGWVTFQMSFTTQLDAADVFVTWDALNGAPCRLATRGQSGCAQISPTTLTVTPEPATWALVGTGLVSIAIIARRRRANLG